MKRMFIVLAAVALGLGLTATSASAAATDSAMLWSGLGSGHTYNGTYDSCTGAIIASGTTTGATGIYAESVTGSYTKATGALTITSVYGLDGNGVIDDSSGTNNSAYSYTMTGTVTSNWFSGTYTITKTPFGGTSVTSDPAAFSGVWFEVSDNGGTCTPPPVLDGGNHGQCVSAKAKAGITGKDLAVFAKDVSLVGPTCTKVTG